MLLSGVASRCSETTDGSPKKKGGGQKKAKLNVEGKAVLIYPVRALIHA